MIQSAIILLLFALLSVSHALAISNPVHIILNTVKVFENIWVAGDILLIGEHNIDYALEPTQNAEDAFQLQLRSTDNTTLIRLTGATDYQWNLTSIYFSPTQATANITWGNAYYVRISGNPAMFGTLTEDTNMDTVPLAPTDWNEDETLTSKELLIDYCLDVAARMEDDAGITLITTTSSGESVLNATGTTIFLAAVPNLDDTIPELFQITSGTAIITAGNVTAIYENETTILLKLGSQIADAFSGIATWLGISAGMAAGMWIVLFMLTIASIVFLNTGNTTGAMILAVPVAVMGGYLGAIPLTLLFTVGIFLVAYMYYFFWLRGT